MLALINQMFAPVKGTPVKKLSSRAVQALNVGFELSWSMCTHQHIHINPVGCAWVV